MIVKNEEDTLSKCLDSVQSIVDEIIIVDTGSTDQTKRVASMYTDKIYDFEWIDDFSAARNYSFSLATKDYILWLDADDVLLEDDQKKFLELKQTLPPEVDSVMMKYNTGFDNEGNVTFSYYRERLVRRSKNYLWREPVHEYIFVRGNSITSDIAVTHTKKHHAPSKRNIQIYEKQLAAGKELSPRGLYYYARELKDNGLYKKAIEYFEAFLRTEKGWVEDNINACHDMAKCYEQEHMPNEQIQSLFRSFIYDTPRAEVCCSIGYFYKSKGDYRRAIFWFKLASSLEKPKDCLGFIYNDSWDFIPYIELSVCYDRIGNIDEAEKYNELAGKCKPNNPSYLHNRNYFKALRATLSK